VKCAVVTTTTPDIVSALDGLCDRLASDLEGARPDLLVAFFTPHHGGDATTLRRRIVDRLSPAVLLGCPGAGVIGSHEEVEGRTGLTLWGAAWPGADIVPFRIEADERDGEPALTGWPERVPDDPGFLVLADPYTTPGDTLLAGWINYGAWEYRISEINLPASYCLEIVDSSLLRRCILVGF
jgi:small ligand-binding sensory domain FIST